MKPFLIILIFLSAVCSGQTTYNKVKRYTNSQLSKLKDSFPTEYYDVFLKLLSKRDSAYLINQIALSKSRVIYWVEGYNFETGQYSLFEEYKDLDSKMHNASLWPYGIFKLDRAPVRSMLGSYFLYEKNSLRVDSALVDTIFPRKYRFGAGCVVTDSAEAILSYLSKKAKQDGIVIEKYCKIETLIDKSSNKIFVKFLFPVKGLRIFKGSAGMLSDYPPGLDFWLFASPYILDN